MIYDKPRGCFFLPIFVQSTDLSNMNEIKEKELRDITQTTEVRSFADPFELFVQSVFTLSPILPEGLLLITKNSKNPTFRVCLLTA